MSATPYHIGIARHILLIDEDPTTLMILESLPEPADDKWFFHQASTTNAADLWLETHKIVPDLVLVDMDIRCNGAGCEYIKKLREKFSNRLLILCTSMRRSNEVLRQAIDAQANDFIYKPFNKYQLLSRFECMFASHQLSASATEAQINTELMRRSLPTSVCYRLERGEEFVYELHQMISIMLITVTSTASSSSEEGASAMANAVDEFYSFVQQEARGHELHTMPLAAGLVFVVVGGINDSTIKFLSNGSQRMYDHVEEMVRFGQSVMNEGNTSFKETISISISMHCGPARGFVVSSSGIPRYMLTGATMDHVVAVAHSIKEGSFVITREVRTQLTKLGYSDKSGIFRFTPVSVPFVVSDQDSEGESQTSSTLFYVGPESSNATRQAHTNIIERLPVNDLSASSIPADLRGSHKCLTHSELVKAYKELEEEHERALVEMRELREEVRQYRKGRQLARDPVHYQRRWPDDAPAFGEVTVDHECDRRLLRLNKEVESLMDRIRYLNTTGRPLD